MTNILVLGVSGMLGSMVFNYLSKNSDFNVYGTVRNPKFLGEKLLMFDANDLLQLENEKFFQLRLNFIINCIGITKPFCRDEDPKGVERAIKINAEFPWILSKYSMRNDVKVIQIATDCVYSGKRGNYNENDLHDPLDVYGKTKSLGEVFDGSILNIRCSIIGPEFKQTKSFLFEWFLNQPYEGTIGGYEHHIWNGVTTLQFAQLCEKIIDMNSYDDLIELSHIHHYHPNKTVNKYQLMQIFSKVFGKKLEINRVNIPEELIDRTLTSNYSELDKLSHKSEMKDVIFELKKYIDNCEIYNYKV